MIRSALLLCLACAALATAQSQTSFQDAAWLWVMDQHTQLGIPDASIDIGPGRACLNVEKKPENITWTAHYKTGPAGRVLVHGLPQQFSCRVTLHGREIPVESTSRSLRPPRTNASVAVLWVDLENRGIETVEEGYWQNTNDPTLFRDYIEDEQQHLIAGVRIHALRSGVSTTSDANGLFTLEVPASYRKGKPPSLATETLVFSKPGYRTLEYRDLVLRPGVDGFNIVLEKGSGIVVRRNLALGNGQYEDFTFNGPVRWPPDGYSGEIISFVIERSTFDGGWNLCQRGAKAILKGRNLKSVEIFFYSTGTGVGEFGPASAGQMTKLQSSPQGDTWELLVPDILANSFWAQAIDTNGKTIKSLDLGGVAYDIRR